VCWLRVSKMPQLILTGWICFDDFSSAGVFDVVFCGFEVRRI
jgi:hypothetical protein